MSRITTDIEYNKEENRIEYLFTYQKGDVHKHWARYLKVDKMNDTQFVIDCLKGLIKEYERNLEELENVNI